MACKFTHYSLIDKVIVNLFFIFSLFVKFCDNTNENFIYHFSPAFHHLFAPIEPQTTKPFHVNRQYGVTL